LTAAGHAASLHDTTKLDYQKAMVEHKEILATIKTHEEEK